MNKVSGVYKITNTITGDFYIGSSINIKKRWICHKSPSHWAKQPGIKLYQAFIKYGLDNFAFEVIEETVMLKEREQFWIDQFHPSYNSKNANGLDIERHKKACNKASKKWNKINHDKCLSYHNEWGKRICSYKGEILTLAALRKRFHRQGIAHPTNEAMKYLIDKDRQ